MVLESDLYVSDKLRAIPDVTGNRSIAIISTS